LDVEVRPSRLAADKAVRAPFVAGLVSTRQLRQIDIQGPICMRAFTINASRLAGALALCLANSPAFADVIEMQNGDRYGGTVIAVNGTNLLFQSETQGRINLPRDKVSKVTFG